jgi:hypothetical protein
MLVTRSIRRTEFNWNRTLVRTFDEREDAERERCSSLVEWPIYPP